MLDDGTSHIHVGAKLEMSYYTPVLWIHWNAWKSANESFFGRKNLDNLADNHVIGKLNITCSVDLFESGVEIGQIHCV